MKRLSRLLLRVVALGGDDPAEETLHPPPGTPIAITNHSGALLSYRSSLAYATGRGCGLVYTWLKDGGTVVQGPCTAAEGGACPS